MTGTHVANLDTLGTSLLHTQCRVTGFLRHFLGHGWLDSLCWVVSLRRPGNLWSRVRIRLRLWLCYLVCQHLTRLLEPCSMVSPKWKSSKTRITSGYPPHQTGKPWYNCNTERRETHSLILHYVSQQKHFPYNSNAWYFGPLHILIQVLRLCTCQWSQRYVLSWYMFWGYAHVSYYSGMFRLFSFPWCQAAMLSICPTSALTSYHTFQHGGPVLSLSIFHTPQTVHSLTHQSPGDEIAPNPQDTDV